VKDLEPAFCNDALDLLDGSKGCLVVVLFAGAKHAVPRYCREKRDLVNEHQVAAQNKVSIVGHDGGWDACHGSLNASGSLSRCFAFEGPNVRSKNGIGDGDITPSDWTIRQQLVVNF
jgi:hypothetical protein